MTTTPIECKIQSLLLADRTQLIKEIAGTIRQKITDGEEIIAYLESEQYMKDFAMAGDDRIAKTRKKSGYHLFQTWMAHKLSDEGYSTEWRRCFIEAASRWKTISDEERSSWNDKARESTDTPVPSKPINAFNHFKHVQNIALKQSEPGLTAAERVERIKKEWHTFSHDIKHSWKARAAEARV